MENEYKLIEREVFRLGDLLNKTLKELNIDYNKPIEVSKLPIVFSVLSNKLDVREQLKEFAFAQIKINPTNGYKLINVPVSASGIDVGDWVAIISLKDIRDIDKVRDMVKLMEDVQFIREYGILDVVKEYQKLVLKAGKLTVTDEVWQAVADRIKSHIHFQDDVHNIIEAMKVNKIGESE